MIKTIPPLRGQDDFGSGSYHAPRGNNKHRGIDFACAPGSRLLSPCGGIVTKHGVPYKQDGSPKALFKYIEITNEDDLRFRFFYTKPLPKVNTIINVGDVIGVAQDIAKIYTTPTRKMTPHFHFEVLTEDDNDLDPMLFLGG